MFSFQQQNDCTQPSLSYLLGKEHGGGWGEGCRQTFKHLIPASNIVWHTIRQDNKEAEPTVRILGVSFCGGGAALAGADVVMPAAGLWRLSFRTPLVLPRLRPFSLPVALPDWDLLPAARLSGSSPARPRT